MNHPHDISAYGARAEDGYDNTAAIQKAIEAAARQGGRVTIPPGEFSSGTLFLRAGVELHLCRGAILRAIPSARAFPWVRPRIPSRMDARDSRAFLYAEEADRLALTGSGRIECGGAAEDFQSGLSNDTDRPYGIHFVDCRDVRIENIILRNAGLWMLRLLHCDRVRVTGIDLFNHCNLNNDGLDLDCCRDVLVSGCRIDSSDDALCVKSEGLRDSENVVVSDCILSSHASAIKLGTGSVGGYRRIIVRDCLVRPSRAEADFHPRGLRGGVCGINLATVDGGRMEDVLVSGIRIQGVETPLFVRLGQRLSRDFRYGTGGEGPPPEPLRPDWGDAPPPSSGSVEGVTLSDITATECGPVASSLTACAGHRLERIRLRNIYLRLARRPAGEVDETVPDLPESYPKSSMFDSPLPAAGLFLRNVRDLEIDDLRVDRPAGDERPVLWLENAHDCRLARIRGGGSRISEDCTAVARETDQTESLH